jgi:hypothetical protein
MIVEAIDTLVTPSWASQSRRPGDYTVITRKEAAAATQVITP